MSNSPDELMQLIQGFKEVFELPILLMEQVDSQMAALPERAKSDRLHSNSPHDSVFFCEIYKLHLVRADKNGINVKGQVSLIG
jgi:hypothetical protein